MVRFVTVVVWSLAALLLGSAGCSRAPKAGTVSQPTSLVWPAPPETARVAYVGSLHRPADIGIKASGLTRFGRWLTGSEKGNEPLVKPFGLALDEHDNLVVTDTGANVVCYYDAAKKEWHRWGKAGKLRFVSPVAVAKRQGVFFVADSGLGSVVAFDETGQLLFQATNHLVRPSGLALWKDHVYVADSARHCIVVLDMAGNYHSEFGKRGIGPGEYNFPTHLTADSQGNLYVTDSMNSRIQVVDAEGKFKSQLGTLGDSPGQFSRPKGVALDTVGRIYAVDALFDNIQVFEPGGKLLLNLGAAGSEPGEFWLPNGIVISRSNEIYAADSYNRRVQIFKYIGPS